MKPINDEWLFDRLPSGSKSRLYQFRANLMRDEDRRNYDYPLVQEFQKYVLPNYREEYFSVKHYLRDLKSSIDGKYFSQGVKEYSQLMDAIGRFQLPNHPSFQWNKNYQSAKKEMMEEYSKAHLKMVEYHDDESVISTLPKSKTHSGFTFLITGKKSKGENFDNIYSNYVNEENLARNLGSFNKPILPGVRTQSSGQFDELGSFTYDCKHKTRLVSMIDLYVILAELKFAKPFQDFMAKRRQYAGGKDNRAISTVIHNYRSDYYYFTSLDYSAFDQSISKWLIYDAFDIVRSAFDYVDDELLGVIINDFIYKNFVMGRNVYYAQKGVPSGSMFTQIIDSIVNILMVRTYLKSTNNRGDMIVMGDDNLLYTRDFVDIDLISSYITKNFGVKVNADKSSSGLKNKDPEFLSRYWRSDGQFREPHTVISKMLYPERKRTYDKAGKVTPQMVLFAYYLTYPITMYRIMDVDKFLRDNPNLKRSVVEDLVDSRYIPGALAYIREYTGAA